MASHSEGSNDPKELRRLEQHLKIGLLIVGVMMSIWAGAFAIAAYLLKYFVVSQPLYWILTITVATMATVFVGALMKKFG